MKHLKTALKGMTFFSVVLFLLFLSSCDDSEELTFPVTYKYQGIDFQPSKYYVLTANAYTEIPATGNYVNFDQIFSDIKLLDIEEVEFPIEAVELLSESQANISFFDYLDYPVSSLVGDYSLSNEQLSFSIQGVTDTFPLLLSTDYGKANFPLFSHHFSYKSNGITNYSPIRTKYETADVPTFIASLRQKWNLMEGDTVALNFSGYVYAKQ